MTMTVARRRCRTFVLLTALLSSLFSFVAARNPSQAVAEVALSQGLALHTSGRAHEAIPYYEYVDGAHVSY